MKIIFVFIDGLGIGENRRESNPCAQPPIRLFNCFLTDRFTKLLVFDGLCKPIDAQLGIPGIPQSATGQAALFTGQNAAKLLNRHVSGFPNPPLRDLVAAHSIHQKLKSRGKRPAFINVYRPIFFERGPEALLPFLSVTSIANWQAGLPFFDLDHLLAKQAIYHDFTNFELKKMGFDVPLFTAEQAAMILAQASQHYDFCLYEYFITDWVGHGQNMELATHILVQLERFVFTLITQIDLSDTLLLVTSDHGNVEDISIKTHTTHPVPLMAWGKFRQELLDNCESLIDVTPTLLKLIDHHELMQAPL